MLSLKDAQLLPIHTPEPSARVKEIDALIAQADDDTPELYIQRAEALGEQSLLREAIASLSRAIATDPFCGILYRYRGHKYLNLGCVEEACADFAVASRFIPENFAVWYHLGICYVLLQKYALAERAYTECEKLYFNTERVVAQKNWKWIALMGQGKAAEAEALLADFDFSVDAATSLGYLNVIRVYKGMAAPESLLEGASSSTSFMDRLTLMTQAFGVACYYRIRGETEKLENTLDYILELGDGEGWFCFGYAGARYWKHHF
ncbi:hypothetical protein LJC27_04780 [Christensenellaceae bacterium OttesenSCG-928-M15]|nr:hypothetical protein [Christensenellaceae bacterium OttesenSCG-928-M15]